MAKPPGLILSMSDISAFMRCKRSFAYKRLLFLREEKVSAAAEAGTQFHAEMQAYANERRGTPVQHFSSSDEMFEVAMEYQRRRAAADFDDMEVLAVEEPLYLPIVPANANVLSSIMPTIPTVYVRTTFDLVYRRRSTSMVSIRDYKTFERAPSYDVDLDFQGRLYIASAMQYYKTANVLLEYENVRRTRPQPWSKWAESECYINNTLVIPLEEAVSLWQEVQQATFDILMSIALDPVGTSAVWYREPLKVGPHSCASCFQNAICKADLSGAIDVTDPETLGGYATVMPPEHPAWFVERHVG